MTSKISVKRTMDDSGGWFELEEERAHLVKKTIEKVIDSQEEAISFLLFQIKENERVRRDNIDKMTKFEATEMRIIAFGESICEKAKLPREFWYKNLRIPEVADEIKDALRFELAKKRGRLGSKAKKIDHPMKWHEHLKLGLRNFFTLGLLEPTIQREDFHAHMIRCVERNEYFLDLLQRVQEGGEKSRFQVLHLVAFSFEFGLFLSYRSEDVILKLGVGFPERLYVDLGGDVYFENSDKILRMNGFMEYVKESKKTDKYIEIYGMIADFFAKKIGEEPKSQAWISAKNLISSITESVKIICTYNHILQEDVA